MKAKPTSPVMTLKQAHRVIEGITYPTFWRWAKGGKLPTVTIAGKIFVLREPFMRLFEDPGRRPTA